MAEQGKKKAASRRKAPARRAAAAETEVEAGAEAAESAAAKPRAKRTRKKAVADEGAEPTQAAAAAEPEAEAPAPKPRRRRTKAAEPPPPPPTTLDEQIEAIDDDEPDEGDEAEVELDAASVDAVLRAAAAAAAAGPADAAVEDEEERLAAVQPPPRRRRAARADLGELPPVPEPLSIGDAARKIGIEQLYPEQVQVVSSVAQGRDVLLVLPTGFGKSATYQVPAMVLPRPVVVVSPLLALLEDQHSKLLDFGVRVARLDGTVRGNARKRALADVARGGPILVMTTPETLANPELREALGRSGVGLVAVDEAHCISEWGYDFRPAYRRLGARVRELGAPPVLALTATATQHVREAIVGTLGMRDPDVIAASPHRSNLAFEVLACEGDLRLRALLRLARRLHRPGIVYCSTRREVDLIYMLIRRFGIPAHRYHGGMTAKEREAEQERFMDSGRRVVMVATSAFGLGIDKPDIRYVMHFQAPASLEQYVQEAGRGGRDGKKANCILLYDGSDRGIHEALLSRSRVRPDQLYRLAAALAAWADEEREPSLEALALSAEMGPRIAAALLTKLEEAGLVVFDEDRIQVPGSKETLEQDARALAGQFETLRTQDGHRLDALAEYARDEGCRANFLRAYFGESEGAPCGLCDVCRGRPERPEAFFAPIAKPAQPGRRRRGGRGRDVRPARDERGRGRRGRGARDRQRDPERERARGGAEARPREPGPGLGAGGGAGRGRRRRGRRGGRGHAAARGPESLIAPEILAQPFVLDDVEGGPPPARREPRPFAGPGGNGRGPGPARPDDGGPRRRRGRRGGRRRRGPGPGADGSPPNPD